MGITMVGHSSQNLLTLQTGLIQFEPVCGHSSEFIDLQKSHGSEKLNISMTPANIGFQYMYRIKVKWLSIRAMLAK